VPINMAINKHLERIERTLATAYIWEPYAALRDTEGKARDQPTGRAAGSFS